MTMGQHWHVLNVDRKEKIVGVAKLEGLFLRDLNDLYQSLRMPCLPRDVDKWISRGVIATQQGPFGRLSTEVLDMIFKQLLDDVEELEDFPWALRDCLMFAVCCKRLLTIGKRHIMRAFIFRHARDAGCRLVCLGEYAGADDQAPPGMLTDVEHEDIATAEVSHKKGEFGSGKDDDKPAQLAVPPCLYTFASTRYQARDSVVATFQDPLRALRRKFREVYKVWGPELGKMVELDMHMILALGGTDCYACPYPNGPTVLCNLSKGEYILEDTLAGLENDWCRVNLAHALLSRICYSPVPSVSMACDVEYRDRLAKGPWAGDRFCITTVNELPVLKDGKEWKDVTEEANELLRHLCTRDGGRLGK